MLRLFFFETVQGILLTMTAAISFPTLAMNNTPTIFTLSAGPAWSDGGTTQTLTLADEITKTYTANNGSHFSGAAELFVAIQKPLPQAWLAQIGLAFSTYSSARISGEIWDDADPEFNNFNYRYRISHTALTVKGKFLRDFGWSFYPWVSAAIGIGINRAYGFSNTPKIFEAIENPNFANKTITAFTYALGIGVQQRMTCNYQIGIGYEFSNWGRSELGKAAGQTSNNVLTQNNFYTHSLLVNITYDVDDALR